MSVRRALLAGLVAALVAAMISTGGPAAANDAVTVQLDWVVRGDHGIFFVGRDKGFFAAQGIDIKAINRGTGSVVTMRMVGAGQWRTRATRDGADLQVRPDVQHERGVHVGTREGAFVDHTRGSAAAFLGGLKHQLHGAGERGLAIEDELGGAEQHRRVRVMAARVHDARHLRGERHARLLVDGEGVHVRAEQYAWPVAQLTFDLCDHAGLGEPGLEGDPEVAEPRLDEGRGLLLLVAHLRMGVDRAPCRHDPGFDRSRGVE